MDYTIQPGDTLGALAQRFGTTVQALAQANGIANPNMIRAGATLRVPGVPGATPQAAARPAGAPAPTTGAMPVPRPQRVAAMDPMAAPLPNARPAAPTPPQPRPNVFAPGGMTLARLQASSELETALQQQQQQERLRMQQQDARMREQAAAMPLAAPQQPSFISPQMESYAAGPAAPREQGIPGARGLPLLSEMSMNDFNQLRLEFANIPASRRQPGMQEAIEAEARRRVDQLRAEVARLDQTPGMRDVRQAAWQNAGQEMPRTQGPQMPMTIPGNPANPMPQGQPMAGVPLGGQAGQSRFAGMTPDELMAARLAQPNMTDAEWQEWSAAYDAAIQMQRGNGPVDPTAAMIQQLRGGGASPQVPVQSLIRVLQAGA